MAVRENVHKIERQIKSVKENIRALHVGLP